jgi:hemolysin III
VRVREPFNAFSHLLGAVLAVLGLAYLVLKNGAPSALAFLVYGFGTSFLFISSATYHWTKVAKPGLQKMDHSAIYVMIATTYVPVALLGIGGKLGIGIIITQAVLCTIGVISTLLMTKPPTWLRLVLYLVMGWMMLPFVGVLIPKIGTVAVIWMFAGGLSYTIGTVVYASKRPTLWPGKFSFHELWHVFVLVGAACHFAVMTYL